METNDNRRLRRNKNVFEYLHVFYVENRRELERVVCMRHGDSQARWWGTLSCWYGIAGK